MNRVSVCPPLRRPWVASILALTLALPLASQEPAPEVVRRSIAHHGGELFGRSTISFRLCSGSGCYDVLVETDDGRFRHRVAGPISTGQREVEATNDAIRHWHDGVERPVGPADEQALRDWATARYYFALLPNKLDDPGVRFTDLGLERWDGRDLRKFKVTFRAGSSTDAEDEFLYWFDPETARLEQFAYSYEGDPGGLRFRPLGNYRRVGGVLFHDQENYGVDAEGLSVDQITPEFVASRMRPISRVRVEQIEVVPTSEAGIR